MDILEKWLSILLDKTSVDIVIPSYRYHPGVKSCIDSIRICTDIPYKIIVVNNGVDPQLDQYLDQQKDIHQIKQGRLNFAQAVNIGIRAGTGTHVCILNDDVIVSRGWLRELRNSCIKGVGAVGPLSNCDQGWYHSYLINIGGVELRPGTNTYQEIEPVISQIYDFKSPYNEEPQRDWVAFYCTLIPRAVIDSVGLLNEEFTNSGEDVDLCNRIRNCGHIIKQNYRSFIFHYGAVSRKLREQEDSGSYYEADRLTNLHLKKLWGKKSVMLFSGPSWEKWDFRNLETTGIGGSEVWITWLSRKLSELGYRVTVFADSPEFEIYDGEVQWLQYTSYNKWIEQHWVDYAILSRTTDPLDYPLRAGKVYVQLHDVFLLSDRNKVYIDKINRFCVLSDWHLGFASDYHNIPKSQMKVMANGIDFKRFDAINVDRNPYRFHWSSSWDRGLDNVVYLWPFIKEQIPEAELHAYYGVYNWKQSCILKNDMDGLKKIESLEKALQLPGVYAHDRVNQKQLAEEISRSSLCLYPSWFSETWGITFVECQYAGVPVICNKYAGLITTLKDSAIMLGTGDAWWPYSEEGRKQFLSETISILKDRNKWQEWSDKGRENANKYSWEKCALRWKVLFEE
jgi:GT2 family glycosyltransferase